MPITNEYWAALPVDELGAKLCERVEGAFTATLTTQVATRVRRAFMYAYGLDPSGVHATSQILRGGEAGELAEVRVNHCRSLVNVLLNLIAAPKVVWSPKATNIDYAALKETDLAAAILEYYWAERHVSRLAVRALEEALYFGEGFVLLDWDVSAGADHGIDPGDPTAQPPVEPKLIKSGDAKFVNVSTWDVIRDPSKTSWEALDWVIVRSQHNRWDLMKQYPDMLEEIQACPADIRIGTAQSSITQVESDDIPVYRFYHKKTPAIPLGRETLFLASQAVLSDQDLRFDDLPLYRVSAGEMPGTSYGYSTFFDILGVQELMDSLHTTIASNQTTFGGQIIVVEEGSEVTPEQVSGGERLLYIPAGAKEPKALQLCSTPPEIFRHLQTLKGDMELTFGLNSVVRGEPQTGDLSGSALALLQSQALQQSSVIQSSYLRMVEGLGSGLIQAVQKFADKPQQIAIVGKNNASLVNETEYTKQDLVRVKRVQVEIGNPLSQTPSGRLSIAKELVQMGLIKTAQQYEQVLTTGKLEPLTQGLHHELLLIRGENEQMSEGQQPPALVSDDHLLHAREHKTVLANPEARRNPDHSSHLISHLFLPPFKQYYSNPFKMFNQSRLDNSGVDNQV